VCAASPPPPISGPGRSAISPSDQGAVTPRAITDSFERPSCSEFVVQPRSLGERTMGRMSRSHHVARRAKQCVSHRTGDAALLLTSAGPATWSEESFIGETSRESPAAKSERPPGRIRHDGSLHRPQNENLWIMLWRVRQIIRPNEKTSTETRCCEVSSPLRFWSTKRGSNYLQPLSPLGIVFLVGIRCELVTPWTSIREVRKR
jgi:hypothetical protein